MFGQWDFLEDSDPILSQIPTHSDPFSDSGPSLFGKIPPPPAPAPVTALSLLQKRENRAGPNDVTGKKRSRPVPFNGLPVLSSEFQPAAKRRRTVSDLYAAAVPELQARPAPQFAAPPVLRPPPPPPAQVFNMDPRFAPDFNIGLPPPTRAPPAASTFNYDAVLDGSVNVEEEILRLLGVPPAPPVLPSTQDSPLTTLSTSPASSSSEYETTLLPPPTAVSHPPPPPPPPHTVATIPSPMPLSGFLHSVSLGLDHFSNLPPPLLSSVLSQSDTQAQLAYLHTRIGSLLAPAPSGPSLAPLGPPPISFDVVHQKRKKRVKACSVFYDCVRKEYYVIYRKPVSVLCRIAPHSHLSESTVVGSTWRVRTRRHLEGGGEGEGLLDEEDEDESEFEDYNRSSSNSRNRWTRWKVLRYESEPGVLVGEGRGWVFVSSMTFSEPTEVEFEFRLRDGSCRGWSGMVRGFCDAQFRKKIHPPALFSRPGFVAKCSEEDLKE